MPHVDFAVRARAVPFCLSVAFLAGCDPAGAVRNVPVAPTPSAAVPVIARDAVLLDSNDVGGSLVAHRAPTRADSDDDRVLVLDAVAGASLAGRHVLDARFVDDGVALLDADHTLRLRRADGTEDTLDTAVFGPLSTASHTVAYVRGTPPDLELARVDTRTRVVTAITHGMAPVWSPALSADANEVLFVSGVRGAPRLYRANANARIEALPESVRTPSSPTAPRWSGSTLIFEDEAGIAWLDVDRGSIVRDVPAAHGLIALSDGTIAGVLPGASLTRLAPPAGGAR